MTSSVKTNVEMYFFLLVLIHSKIMASVDDQLCLVQQNVAKQDFAWRYYSSPFNCIAKCYTANTAISDPLSRKAKYLERVFSPAQKTINCMQNERKVASFCKIKMKTLELNQYSDLPLLYFQSLVQLPKFEAEKFCSSNGLNFGIDESLIEFITIGLTDVKIWMADVQILNATAGVSRKIACTISHKQKSSNLVKQENCQNSNNFVCVLPKNCHLDKCSSRCSQESCDIADAKQPVDNCESNCPNQDCGEEKAERFGYMKPGVDGDVIEACGMQYLFSKIPKYNQRATHTFCCTKHMNAASITTLEEAKCLAREMIKRNLSDFSFWTSARPSNCTNLYTWCSMDGSGEVLDQNLLDIPKNSNPKKQFITVKAIAQTESLAFSFEDPTFTTRAMCSRPNAQTCTSSFCSPMGFKEELEGNKPRRITGLYRSNCKYMYGCRKLFDTCPAKYSYYQGSKWAQANLDYIMKFVTLETKEKMECLLQVLKGNNVKSSTFIVNAMSLGCPKYIRWCEIPDSPLLNNSYIPWEEGEPSMDPTKECVYMKYNAEKNSFAFGKMSCYTELMFISQSSEIYPNNTLGLLRD
ncbi:uncharacterized protein LOC135935854 [Cloeon dipterum]|uniref:uncharacterized protein LOC135935854 n=1 Tax=Cloeon dipterum TaxID=197152 RepID=UPI00321FECAA